MQQELQMKEQAVRTGSIHQEEFLWQSTATWERLWERKKDPGNEGKNCPSMGECQRSACLLGVLLALRRLESEEGSLVGSGLEASKNNQTPVVDSV